MVKYICSVLSLAIAVSVAFAQVQDTPGFEDDPESEVIERWCISGGPGASSCSNHIGGGYTGISGDVACSVSCDLGLGYYACCDEVSCKCRSIHTIH